MCERQTSCQKHLSHVTQAQFITETPQDSEQDNICREFKIIERRASPFIKGTATVRAKERGVAQLGFLCSFLRRRYHARGTVHEPTLLVQLYLFSRSITDASFFFPYMFLVLPYPPQAGSCK